MKALKVLLGLVVVCVVGVAVWLGVIYRTYGMQTLLFVVQAPPDILLTYTKNAISPAPDVPSFENETLLPSTDPSSPLDPTEPLPTNVPISIPPKHMITSMSHTYQKLNNCGPSTASMAASTLGVSFDQFAAAAVLKGSDADKNVAADELARFIETQGLRAAYRINGTQSIVEQLVANDIPVIVEQWLIKRGNGEMTGHYRVVRGYDQSSKIFITNDSFNGPNFVIPYSQFEEWWRPFARGYVVVYKPEQEQLVRSILGSNWDVLQNQKNALTVFERETQSIGDGYAYFNLGTAAALLKEYRIAGTAYDKALQTTFPEHYLWYQFGPLDAYTHLGEYDKVKSLSDTLIGQAGEVEEARYYRGLSTQRQGQIEDARVEYELAVKANPRYQPAIEALRNL